MSVLRNSKSAGLSRFSVSFAYIGLRCSRGCQFSSLLPRGPARSPISYGRLYAVIQDLAETPLKGFAEQRVGQWDALGAQVGTFGEESLLDISTVDALMEIVEQGMLVENAAEIVVNWH